MHLAFNLTKLKLERLKFGFMCKKWKYEKSFASLDFDFFRVQLKFSFRIRPKVRHAKR